MPKTDSDLLKEVAEIVRREQAALVAIASMDGGLTDYSLKDGMFRLISISDEVIQRG